MLLVQGADLAQHAVDPVADAQEARLGLEVQVAGAPLHGVGQYRLDQTHHGTAVVLAARVQALDVELTRLDLVQDAVDRPGVLVVFLDRGTDLAFGADDGADAMVGRQLRAQPVEQHDVVGIGDRHLEGAGLRVEGHRERQVGAGKFPADHPEGGSVGNDVRQVGLFGAHVGGQRVAQHGLREKAQRDEHLADGLLARGLLDERDAQLVLGDEAALDQHPSQGQTARRARLRRRGRRHGIARAASVAHPGCTGTDLAGSVHYGFLGVRAATRSCATAGSKWRLWLCASSSARW